VNCPGCGFANDEGKKFCTQCGTPLALACPSCGASIAGEERFCGECGASLAAEAVAPAVQPSAPAAERRLVSVLFADLVGFTTLSESRDSEEVRELLSRYFESCRRLIELYGGTVEKFIGDAVMAVWCTPTATEDDAERAVRAALDLVAAVSALGDEVGASELRARAAVLTGEAAVTIGAEGQGMVAGDLVNTASRVQSIAEPGQVLVGESTRRSTEPTVVYESAGAHELKGKAGLVLLWRALRVVSGARGSLKSQGLEAPFVGRERELRLVKDLFHDSENERRPHLISITGIAGVGKSRLSWEFFKYLDGVAQTTYYHRGRCLSYGDGVTYWALADMVRMRARIAEDEQRATALPKLQEVVAAHIQDEEERSFVEPRLAHLLGLEEGSGYEREDLFAAWRLFFERLADVNPVLMVFEDMQWADASLLDFVEYLLEWSRSSPICVVTLARPELLERRQTWGAGRRNFSSIYLEPLSEQAMTELLSGLVPGLPDQLRAQILERAEGIPLYAVETVRMLLDRGLLVQEGSVYRPAGTIEALEVPETLQALIAARLDGLPAGERQLVQDAAVLGKTFTINALAALSGLSESQLEPLLASLVRREVVSIQADPRSPEHGQYAFLQDLMRRVAYETLSKRDRRARHLAAAEHLAAACGHEEDEVVEVVASHYVDAYEAVPDADDAGEIREKARTSLVRAAEHAVSLAAASEARRYFAQAAELAGSPPERAELLARAGEMAGRAGDPESAARLLEEAIALYEAEGDTHAAARASIALGRAQMFSGRRDEAIERLERAFAVISTDEPDEAFATLAAQLSRAYWFSGDLERAAERAELALDIAETEAFVKPMALALRAKGAVLHSRGHAQEGHALTKHALDFALEHDLADDATTCYFILSDRCFRRDRYAEALGYLEEALALARRLGNRPAEWGVLAERTYPLLKLGRWDEAIAIREEFTEEQINSGGVVLSLLESSVEIYVNRGELDEARRMLSLFSRLEGSTDLQDQKCYVGTTAILRRAEGRLEEALSAGAATLEGVPIFGANDQSVKQGVVEALEAALALGDSAKAEELFAFIEDLPAGRRPAYLEAQARRLRSRIAGEAEGIQGAARMFRELEIPFWLAVTLLEHAELTGDQASLAEARGIFERLGAAPWLERAGAAQREEVPA
jgi:class 3 adenylate cyclase/tetratricopeptide (TPR) repeat protein